MLKPPNVLEISVRLYVKDRETPEEARNEIVESLRNDLKDLFFSEGQRGSSSTRKQKKNSSLEKE